MSIRRENYIRNLLVFSLELFTLFSLIFFLYRGEIDRILLCAATIVLILLPKAAERLFRCRLSLGLFLFCAFYAIGALLGHCWKFYYRFPFWDSMLHLMGGIAFAVLGVYLSQRAQGKPWMTVVFALCFSIAVAAIWEFFEYGMDRFFAMDMQNDTVVHSIHSYMLGDSLGALGSIEQIEEISIHGQELGLGGYLDLGLIDTMNDMLFESLGALLYVLLFIFIGGKRQPIRPAVQIET